VRAVGVQSFPADDVLVFAVNTFERFSTPASGEIDIFIDVDGDGNPDFDVVSVDVGLLTTGVSNGQAAVAVLQLPSFDIVSINFLTDAPTDGSTLLLPVFMSDLGVTPSKPRFTYFTQFFNLATGAGGEVPGLASFNAFAPAVSTGNFVTVAAGARAIEPVQVDAAEQAQTPALGWLVVNKENRSGADQAAVLRLRRND
jgi:hypothetical protein